MKITLYELGQTRSARCRWTLLELGLEFESIDGRPLLHTDELKKLHPMGKLPAVVIDGRPLFESGAICTFLADAHLDKDLIAPPGTWQRALHEQWLCFTFSELEAWLWHNAKHTFVYPEEDRIAEVIEPNGREFKAGAAVIEDVLTKSDYLIDNTFSVIDIITGFSLNWGRRTGLTQEFDAINTYLDRLYTRPHCTFAPPA